jgi:hypothetical protein
MLKDIRRNMLFGGILYVIFILDSECIYARASVW